MCYRTISPLRPITTIASTVNTALVCLNGPLPNSEGFTVCKEEEDEEAEVGHAVQLSKYCPAKKGHGRRARAGACGTTVVVGDGRWSGHPIIGHGCFNHSMNSGGGGGGVTHSRPRPKLCLPQVKVQAKTVPYNRTNHPPQPHSHTQKPFSRRAKPVRRNAELWYFLGAFANRTYVD